MTSQLDMLTPPTDHRSPEERKRDRLAVLGWYCGHTGTSTDCARALTGPEETFTVAQVLRYRPRATELKAKRLLEVVPDVPRKETGFGGTAAVLRISALGRYEAGLARVDGLSRLLGPQ